jgi:cellulose synthase/poly-beta-1,6-N-acetylglucosamine synthase-like glycosyltransferase
MNVVRQGYRVIYDPEALSEEDTTGNVAKEFTRRVRIGAGNFQAFFWLLHFLNPRYGWPWFCFVSHKVTRWFSPLFILALMLSCGFLFWQGEKAIYKMIFATGSIFLSAGLLINCCH